MSNAFDSDYEVEYEYDQPIFEYFGSMQRNRDRWVYDDLIHGELGEIYARPKVGKSYLATSAAIAMSEGKPWMKRKIDRPYKVMYWALDGGARNEMVDRREDLGPSIVDGLKGVNENLAVSTIKPKNTPQWWKWWIRMLKKYGIEYVFIDNLLNISQDGVEINGGKELGAIWGNVSRIVDAGIGVTVVHHSGKMNEERGHQNDTPLGATENESKVRYLLHLNREWKENDSLMTITGYGNAGAPKTLYAAFYPQGMGEDGAFFTLLHEELGGGVDVNESMEDNKARALASLEKKLSKPKSPEKKQQQRADEGVTKVVEFLKEQSGPVKQGTITSGVRMHQDKVKEILSTMEKNGKAKSSTQGRAILWELTD